MDQLQTSLIARSKVLQSFGEAINVCLHDYSDAEDVEAEEWAEGFDYDDMQRWEAMNG